MVFVAFLSMMVEKYSYEMYACGTTADTQKMLQAIINGQSAMKEEVLNRINALERKVDNNHESLSDKLNEVEDVLTGRMDKIGI